MRWYLVVEGRQTEKKIYRAWLRHAFPSLEGVGRIEDMAEARYYLGLTLKQRGQTAAAIEQLREAVRVGPQLAAARLQLGVALQEAGDLDGAWYAAQAAWARTPA